MRTYGELQCDGLPTPYRSIDTFIPNDTKLLLFGFAPIREFSLSRDNWILVDNDIKVWIIVYKEDY